MQNVYSQIVRNVEIRNAREVHFMSRYSSEKFLGIVSGFGKLFWNVIKLVEK